MDGTLAKTFYHLDHSFQKAMEMSLGDCRHIELDRERIEFTDSSIFSYFHTQVRGKEPDSNTLEHMKNNFLLLLKEKQQKEPEYFDEIPGAVEFVKLLRSQPGYVVGLASGGWEKPIQFKLKHLKLEWDRQYMASADDHASKREFTRMLIDRVKLIHSSGSTGSNQGVAEKITYIGDSRYDRKSAAELGIRFIGIDFLNQGLLQSEGEQRVIYDYRRPKELLQLLEADW
jgi:phosphoglycolate phosphatase-like HAD superfamily hydrolase